VLEQIQAVDEQLRQLEGGSSMGDLDDWKEAQEKRTALDCTQKVKLQENIAKRAVSIHVLFCSNSGHVMCFVVIVCLQCCL